MRRRPKGTGGRCAAPPAGPPALVLTLAMILVGCGDPSPRILASHEPAGANDSTPAEERRALTEDVKVSRLINRVRASGLVFLRARRELTAGEFGDHLLVTFRRHRGEIDKARDLIERATRPRGASGPVMVRNGDGTELEAREWLHNRLDEIESGTTGKAGQTPKPSKKTERRLRVSDVFSIITHSDAQFVVPQRKGPPETMNAEDFASMLRQKWEWLGNDIEDVDTFVREIASDSFTAFEPYLIKQPGQEPVPVQSWLLEEVEKKRQALATAQVGSP